MKNSSIADEDQQPWGRSLHGESRAFLLVVVVQEQEKSTKRQGGQVQPALTPASWVGILALDSDLFLSL